MTDKKKYHNILVPLKDTIESAGPEILKNFEAKSKDSDLKNLMVLPPEMISELGLLQKRGSFGAEDFLKALDDNKINFDASTKDYVVYNLLDRLDVAVLKGESVNKNYKSFEDRINSFWSSTDDSDPLGTTPKFITNIVSERVNIKTEGLVADRPNFLLEDADIVKKGILIASNKFSEKIFSNGTGEMSVEEAIDLLNPEDEILYPNQFIKIRGEQDKYARVFGDLKRSASGKIVGYDNIKVKLLDESEYNRKIKIGGVYKQNIWGISPWDMEQYLAFQYGLFNDDVETFFLTGSQGSGKTLFSYVAAVDQILWYDSGIAKTRGYGLNSKGDQKRSKFRNIVLLKPNNVIGDREIGFLPGNMFEKLKPHLEPYIDAHKESELYQMFRFEELLTHPKWDTQYFKQRSEQVKKLKLGGEAYLPGDSEAFEMTYSGFMRGRSLKDTLIIVDEGSNYTPYEMKTICERVGPGSKMIVMGDPYQIDNKNCTRDNNGLVHAIKHYLPMPYSALIHLPKNYRSQMSEDSLTWKVYNQ